MSTAIATVLFGLGIFALFRLDREETPGVSRALWIPVVWMSIGSSRQVSHWLQVGDVLTSPDQYLDGSPLDRFILTGILAAGVIVLLSRWSRVSPFLRLNGPLLVFFAYCAVSAFWSDFPFVAFKRWSKGLGNLVMVLIVLTETNPPAAVRRLLARAGFLLIPLSVLLIKYYPALGRGYSPWTWTPVPVGVAYDKNGLGAICLVFGLGCLWRFLEGWQIDDRRRARKVMIVHGAVLVMTAWLLWKANSATSLGCFLVGSGLLALSGWRGLARRPTLVHVLAVLLVASCLYGIFVAPTAGLVEAMGRDPTLTGRTQLWSEILAMTTDPWFGTGFESFWLGERAKSLWQRHWWHPNEAHNGYLEIFITLGWLGVGLLGMVMLWGYRNVMRSLDPQPELRRFRLTYCIVAVLYNITEAAFKVMNPVWITFLLAIVATPPSTPNAADERDERHERRGSRRPRSRHVRPPAPQSAAERARTAHIAGRTRKENADAHRS
jgi:exopolysaccharide production protein ExoQ